MAIDEAPDSETEQAEHPSPDSSAPKKKRGLGHIADPPDDRDYRATSLFGAPRNLSGEASLEQWVHTICDQLDSSSCVANAVANAIDIRLRKMGLIAPFPSRLAIYAMARVFGRFSEKDPLTDGGSMPRLAFKTLRDIGVIDEAKWPFDLKMVNKELPWDVLQQASAFRLSSWWRIVPSGLARTVEMAHAIDQGYPVPFATLVDGTFMGWEPSEENHNCLDPMPFYDASKAVGGHMLLAIGYTTLPDGRRRFKILNSWGPGWGNNGYFFADEEWLAQDVVSDCYVVQVGAV